MTNDVKQYLGDTKVITLTLTDQDDQPINLTGATVYLTIKKSARDADTEAVLQKTVTTHSSPTTGETVINISPADTRDKKAGKYYYDIQLTEAEGKVTTINIGRWELLQDITHTS